MLICPDEKTQFARLLSFLLLGEQLAQDCARGQAGMVTDPGMRRFLRAQARQEVFHARVFQGAILWLAPRGINHPPTGLAMRRYRDLIEDAMQRGDLAETLLGQQVILECLGDAVLEDVSARITARGMGFDRLRRTILKQEHAHHGFGLRRLNQLVDTAEVSPETLRRRADNYLELIDEMLVGLSDLFEFFEQSPRVYTARVRGDLPPWIIGEAS